MLGGRPLPVITVFILNAEAAFVTVSVLVPIIAMGTLFLRGLVCSFYIIGGLGLVTIVQFITLYEGLSAPFSTIVSAMGSP